MSNYGGQETKESFSGKQDADFYALTIRGSLKRGSPFGNET